MPLNPWYVSQTSPLWTETLLNDSGSGANLTGISVSAISLTFTNISNKVVTTRTNGDGSGAIITIVQVNPAIIQYQPCTADAALQGMFHVQVWVTYSNGPEPYDLGIFDVNPK